MGPHDHKATERLARFAAEYAEEKIPTEALENAKAGILDYIGVVLAGVGEESATLVRKTVETMGGSPQALIWGTKAKTSAPLAALVNGIAAHALDLDDTNPVMLAHPSLQLLPGLFALGEYEHFRGRDVLSAYVIGFEVGATLGRALHPNHIAQGWLPIGTLGPIMEAAACARLLGLTYKQVQMALGLASNFASGIRCNSGTMAKHLLAGHGAYSGVMAAILARNGMTANGKCMESPFGYFENFSRGDPRRLEQAIDTLGKPFAILESGISFKLYPCCAGAHVAIDCALDIALRHSPKRTEIEAIDILAHHGLRAILIYPRPRTVSEARFSLEYVVCRALLDREMGPDQFLLHKINDSHIGALMGKANITYYDKALTANDLETSRFPVEIGVRLKNGKVLVSRIEHAKGTIRNPVSRADLEKKFRRCISNSPVNHMAERILDNVSTFEKIRNIHEFVGMLG